MIPAGLLDNNFELFVLNNKAYCLAEGKVWNFPYFPNWVSKILTDSLNENPERIEAYRAMGAKSPEQLIYFFINCCFGAFDGKPDFKDGKLIFTEYAPCDKRGTCPFEGVGCSSIIHEHNISHREVQILQCIHQGMQDKEIADELGIHPTTASKHVKNILTKTALGNRSDLVRFTAENINP